MHLHVIWDAIKSSRLAQAGFLLVVFGGLTEACDQLGAIDLNSIPSLGHYAPAIIAAIGVAKVVFRVITVLIGAFQAKEPTL
jgi:hypothetical protein